MNTQTKLFSAAALATVLAAPALLVAQSVPGLGERMQEHFTAVDSDGDGLLSLDEFLAAREERVEALDADADGFLSTDELSSFEGPHGRTPPAGVIERRMEQADTDGDGVLSFDEVESAHALRFEAADADDDGYLSLDEAGDARPGRRNRGDRSERRERLQELDADSDGSLSREEAEAGDLDFDRMDRNEDGRLDADDRPRRCSCENE